MSGAAGSFDALLAVALLVLAWGALRAADLFKGIVLFVVFGLLMAVAWMRLQAPDIALAEAAIGSGVTGALLLAALARLERHLPTVGEVRPVRAGRLLPGVAALGAILAWSVMALPDAAPGLGPAVAERLAESGAANPVTAVILNFRGYDTLLELAVLLIAVVTAAVLSRPSRGLAPTVAAAPSAPEAGTDPILGVFLRSVTPVFIVVAGYLVWVGAHGPGGAFQAGALLAGAGIVALLAGRRLPTLEARRRVRLVLAAGVLSFVAAGLAGLGAGAFLEYPPARVELLLLAIEVASTAAIALTLALLFGYCAYGRSGDGSTDAATGREVAS